MQTLPLMGLRGELAAVPHGVFEETSPYWLAIDILPQGGVFSKPTT